MYSILLIVNKINCKYDYNMSNYNIMLLFFKNEYTYLLEEPNISISYIIDFKY